MSIIRDTLGVDKDGKGYSARVNRTDGKKRTKREGHDELIARLSPVGTLARLYLSGGEIMEGTLKGSDRFTVTLENAKVVEPMRREITDESSPVVLVYKHSIDFFTLKIVGRDEE